RLVVCVCVCVCVCECEFAWFQSIRLGVCVCLCVCVCVCVCVYVYVRVLLSKTFIYILNICVGVSLFSPRRNHLDILFKEILFCSLTYKTCIAVKYVGGLTV